MELGGCGGWTVGCTGCHLIETVDHVALVFVPGDSEAGGGEGVANPIVCEGFAVGELRYVMYTPSSCFGVI